MRSTRYSGKGCRLPCSHSCNWSLHLSLDRTCGIPPEGKFEQAVNDRTRRIKPGIDIDGTEYRLQRIRKNGRAKGTSGADFTVPSFASSPEPSRWSVWPT